jgi:hypothetical protein
LEKAVSGFEDYGKTLDSMPADETELRYHPERRLLFEEAKTGCMLGMLLCLDRNQRLAYVLGEIFCMSSVDAAFVMEISPSSFRKQLERSRKDLTSYMNEKCGLVNSSNPCRCSKKTAAFIKAGWVDPGSLKFTQKHLESLKQILPTKEKVLCELYDIYADHFRGHSYFIDKNQSDFVKSIFNLIFGGP